MRRKWPLLTILYRLKVMYLYILTLATWHGRLKAIVVFLGKEGPYLQIGEPFFHSYADEFISLFQNFVIH